MNANSRCVAQVPICLFCITPRRNAIVLDRVRRVRGPRVQFARNQKTGGFARRWRWYASAQSQEHGSKTRLRSCVALTGTHLYAFVRNMWPLRQDAPRFSPKVFLHLLARRDLTQVDHAREITLLYDCRLQNYLGNEQTGKASLKRGGRVEFVYWISQTR